MYYLYRFLNDHTIYSNESYMRWFFWKTYLALEMLRFLRFTMVFIGFLSRTISKNLNVNSTMWVAEASWLSLRGWFCDDECKCNVGPIIDLSISVFNLLQSYYDSFFWSWMIRSHSATGPPNIGVNANEKNSHHAHGPQKASKPDERVFNSTAASRQGRSVW